MEEHTENLYTYWYWMTTKFLSARLLKIFGLLLKKSANAMDNHLSF